MIFNKKKKAIKNGELFLVKDLHQKFNLVGISKRHVDEYFSSKHMTWEELDSALKMIGQRDNIQDVIGLPPHMRKEVEKVISKSPKEKKESQEEMDIKDYLKSIDSEIKKANKNIKLEKSETKKNKIQRPVRQIVQKEVVPNEDIDWLKSIPTEQQKSHSRENEVQKETNVKADFESAGGVK